MGSNNHFATISKFAPGTPFVEAFGLLTASLLLNGLDGKEGLRIVSITAAHEGDGASTTALNLALSAANTGRRTLLIDSNIRKPALHEPFGVPQAPGLAETLQKKVALKDAVKASKMSNLYLLPAGGPASPSAVLQALMLTNLFEQIRGTYDFAVIDTPPALRYPDALHVARLTNGIILVVPAEGASRRAQIEVRRRLDRVDAKVLGIVLNRINPKEALAL